MPVLSLSRRRLLSLAPASVLVAGASLGAAEPAPSFRVLRNPGCGCCEAWADHMRKAGFPVEMRETADLAAIRRMAGVPEDLAGCHTGVTADGRVVIEGHVPAFAVRRLLAEPGSWRGIAVPGMPLGSPGMEMPGAPAETYTVVAFAADGRRTAFAKARGAEPT